MSRSFHTFTDATQEECVVIVNLKEIVAIVGSEDQRSGSAVLHLSSGAELVVSHTPAEVLDAMIEAARNDPRGS